MDTLLELLGRLVEAIDTLAALVTDAPITYLVLMAAAAVDVLFPLLPAEAMVTTAAVLAGQGQLDIVWVMLAAGAGAFVGDNVAYWIGRLAGRPLLEKLLRGNTAQLESVARQFRRRGGALVIIGRFIPGGRTSVAVGAGVLHFGWGRYLLYDALAAVVWAVQAAVPGFIGGQLVQDSPWLALVFGFALSALVAVGITFTQRWWDRRQAVAVEVPIRPAVVGIGSVDAQLGPALPAGSRPAPDGVPDVDDGHGQGTGSGRSVPPTPD
jgi:membrane protein DedA with SNARE-associated domain